MVISAHLAVVNPTLAYDVMKSRYSMETRSKKRMPPVTENDVGNTGCGVLDVSNVDKVDNASAIGSCSSNSSVAKFKLDKALIKKRQIERRLDLERELKLLDMQEEIELAKLECIGCESNNEPLPICDREVKSRVEDYLEADTYKECSVVRIGHLENVLIRNVNDALSLVVNSIGLPRIDIKYFEGQPGWYHSFVNQFQSVKETKLTSKDHVVLSSILL